MRFYASIRHEAFHWQFLRSPRFWWQLFRFSGRQSVSKIKTVRFGLHSLCKVVDGKKMNPLLRFLLKLKPGVQKIWLQLLAGLIWFRMANADPVCLKLVDTSQFIFQAVARFGWALISNQGSIFSAFQNWPKRTFYALMD